MIAKAVMMMMKRLVPVAGPSTPAARNMSYRWQKKAFEPSDTFFLGTELAPPADMMVKTPYQYFQRFITDAMIENMVEHTNIYSTQKRGHSRDTSKKELEKMMGMYFRMRLVKMSGVLNYWENETVYQPVCSVMGSNRFRALVANLPFVDNMTVTDDQKKDKVWEIRPWIDATRQQWLLLVPEEYVSIDEIVCQFTGKTSPIRQYIKGKPHPWGFKIWGRAKVSGLLYDFDVYQGGDGQRTKLGQGGDVVLKLTSTLLSHCRYKTIVDNLFTGIPLIGQLASQRIFYTGTARVNRIGHCELKDKKELKKGGRGSLDHRVEQTENIAAVRWFDNKAVTMSSFLVSIEPMTEACIWDKKEKGYKMIPMPAVVREYNQNMGGIDLIDSF